MQLGLLHRTWLGQLLARTWLLRWYFRWSSANLGRKYDAPDSRKLIPRFIRVRELCSCMHACVLTRPLARCSTVASNVECLLTRSMRWTPATSSGQCASTGA